MKYFFLTLIYFFLISCHEKTAKEDAMNVSIDSIYVSKITTNYDSPIYKSDIKVFFKSSLYIKSKRYKIAEQDNYYFSKILRKDDVNYIYEFKFIIPLTESKSLCLIDIKNKYYFIFKSQTIRVEGNGSIYKLNIQKSDETIIKYFFDKVQIKEKDSVNIKKIENFVPKIIINQK